MLAIGRGIIRVRKVFGKVFNVGAEFARDGSPFDRSFVGDALCMPDYGTARADFPGGDATLGMPKLILPSVQVNIRGDVMEAFSHALPVQGFVGGLLIGLAGAVMLLGVGRIAGVSGLTARATGIAPDGAPRGLATAFVLGLPLGALIVAMVLGPVATRFPPSAAILIVGGLLVGFGTRLGSGCTSGHGVCGLSRLSRRSLLATSVFIAAGMVTVAVMNALGFGR